MQSASQLASSPRPILTTLPSELRKLIVSYLTPASVDEIKPGCKRHLQSANLTHSSLREWAPEYLFGDMTLTHVLPGASSNLEIFAVTPENRHLLKHVRHIIVKVSPAIRWEIGLSNPFLLNLEEITQQRLCHRLHVSSPSEMTPSQQEYSASYHEAMVEPFTENRRWYQQLRSAHTSFGRIFAHFANLATISISHCERVDHPRPTATSTFVLQHGREVVEHVHPVFVEDATVNMGWASAVILHSAPPSVKNLCLSLANMDNFSSVAAVNRLLSLSYRHSCVPTSTSYLSNITRLSLSLRGVAGTHGKREWAGDTGSAGSVRFWTREINTMRQLRYLEFTNHLSEAADIRFSGLEHSEPKASVLGWLLPRLELEELRTLALTGFVLLDRDLRDCIKGRWPRLQRLVLDRVTLTGKTPQDENICVREHGEGAAWLAFCREMAAKQPGFAIELVEPRESCAGLNPPGVRASCGDELGRVYGVTLVS